MKTFAAIGFLTCMLCASAASAQFTFLARSGELDANGRAIARFIDHGTDSQASAFLGEVSGIFSFDPSTGVVTSRMKTGAALPAPLVGSFNSFSYATPNDFGEIVFIATLNAASQDDGVFIQEPNGNVIEVSATAFPPFRLRARPDINNPGDVVWSAHHNRELQFFDRSTGFTTRFVSRGANAPGGGTFRRFGLRPVIGDSGEIAFTAQVDSGPDGVFLFNPLTNVIRSVALEGAASPIAGETYENLDHDWAIAIDGTGRVAFGAHLSGGGEGIFVFDSATGTTAVAALVGDTVQGASNPIQGFGRLDYMGIDPSGQVAFFADVGVPLTDPRLVVLSGGLGGSLQTDSPTVRTARFPCPRRSVGGTVWTSDASVVRSLTPFAVSVVASPTLPTAFGVGARHHAPCIANTSGEIVYTTTHRQLYLKDPGQPAVPVIQPGAQSPRGPGFTVTSISSNDYRGEIGKSVV